MTKYIEVVKYFCQQHPLIIIVMGLSVFVLITMWYLAERELKQVVTRLPGDEE